MSDLNAAASPHPGQRMDAAVAMMCYDANKKSAGIAYLFWFFTGILGVHRFYLKRTGSAAAMLMLFVLSVLLLGAAGVGLLGFLVLGIWALIDAFLIPGITRDHNNGLIARMRT